MTWEEFKKHFEGYGYVVYQDNGEFNRMKKEIGSGYLKLVYHSESELLWLELEQYENKGMKFSAEFRYSGHEILMKNFGQMERDLLDIAECLPRK